MIASGKKAYAHYMHAPVVSLYARHTLRYMRREMPWSQNE